MARNAGGTSRGSDQTLATLPNPPTAVTKAPSSVTQTAATLNASVNPNGGALSECAFEYGPTSSYGSSAPCSPPPGSESSPVAVSASITGLSPDVTYHFRLVASNAGGTGRGSDQTLTTRPSAPTIVTTGALSVAETTASLNATVDPNGGVVTECSFEYGPTSSYGSSVPCSAPPGSGSSPVAVSAPVTGLEMNTTYHFRISATNAGGTSKGSDETYKTLANSPAVLTGSASSPSQIAATLNATVDPDGADVNECKFEYGSSTSYESSAPCAFLPGSGSGPVAVSESITGLSADTTYHFRISATNAGGTSKGSDETFRTLPNAPAVVTGTATALTQTTATLNATVDPDGGEVSECELEYGTTASYGSSAPCTSLPGSGTSPVVVSTPVVGLSTTTTYYFRIVAVNPGGKSYGVEQALTTLAPTTLLQQRPSAPEMLPAIGTLPALEDKPPPAIGAELASTSLPVSPGGVVRIKLTCPAAMGSCTGTVTLRTLNAVAAGVSARQSKKRKAAVLIIASGSFRVAAGQAGTLTLRLSTEARRLLAATRLPRARATIVEHDPTGAPHTSQTNVTLHALKAARKRRES